MRDFAHHSLVLSQSSHADTLPHLLTLPQVHNQRREQEDVRDGGGQEFTQQQVQAYATSKKLSLQAGKARLEKLVASKGYEQARHEVDTAVARHAGGAQKTRKGRK